MLPFFWAERGVLVASTEGGFRLKKACQNCFFRRLFASQNARPSFPIALLGSATFRNGWCRGLSLSFHLYAELR